MAETTPIFDEIHRFMSSVKENTPAIESALQKAGKAFEGWHVYIDQWGKQFGKNEYLFGIESERAWHAAERKNQERKAKLRKQRENCLHGRTTFEIRWGVPLKCPLCYSNHVYVDSDKVWCLLCGWKQWRIGKRPRVRFKNG